MFWLLLKPSSGTGIKIIEKIFVCEPLLIKQVTKHRTLMNNQCL